VLHVEDLIGLPLFSSEQGWRNEIRAWAGSQWDKLVLEGSFRLAYNASMFAREGLGYLLTFAHLVDTSEGSGMVFRPLEPSVTTKLYLIWNKYQAFTPIADRFVTQLQGAFREK
jgi:DNA-binding transcriptional LysR family regulator